MNDEMDWCVVWAEARAEKRVAQRLLARGLDVWLPLLTHRRRWSDRWKDVQEPLFPGYLFVVMPVEGYGALLQTPGVRTLVKHGGKPALLTGAYIASLRAAVADPSVSAEPAEERTRFVEGEAVIVQDGPLRGFTGSVVKVRGARRLLVWVAGISRGLLCNLGTASVRPIGG
jgi:transcription antitermination factor NusG